MAWKASVVNLKKSKKSKRTIRKLMGVGHPYFFKARKEHRWPSALMLLDRDRGDPTIISTCDIGAWKKVKCYLEWEK